jgi:hypothetical protein
MLPADGAETRPADWAELLTDRPASVVSKRSFIRPGAIVTKRAFKVLSAVAGLLAVGILVAGIAGQLIGDDQEARKLGFEDASDRASAEHAGVTDPEKWKPIRAARLADEARQRAQAQAAAAAEAKANGPDRLATIQISKESWRKDAFDTVMMASFTLKNTNDFDVKDIEITCLHYGNSGTQIDRNVRTIYEVVKAKGSKTIHDFNMGFIHSQATKSGCAVSKFARSG